MGRRRMPDVQAVGGRPPVKARHRTHRQVLPIRSPTEHAVTQVCMFIGAGSVVIGTLVERAR